jgi:hypothetical protein
MRIRVLFCVLWPLFALSTSAQDSATTDSSAATLHDLIQYYDSIVPDTGTIALSDSSLISVDTSMIDSAVATSSIPENGVVQIPTDDRAEPVPLNSKQKSWVFLILLLISMLIALTRFINPGIHDGLLSEVFTLKKRDDDYEPRGDVKSAILVLFFVIQCLIFGLFAYAFTNYDTLFTFDNSIIDYLLLLTVLVLAFLLKYFAYKFTGDLLVMDSFSSSTIGFLAALGYLCSLLLLPILALKYYNHADWVQEYSLWYFYGLFGLYFLYRGLKLILTSYRNFSFNKIYLFLYLCAVEILPVLLILSAALNYNGGLI